MIFFFSFFFKGFILKNNHRHAFFSRPKKFEICLNLKCFYLPLNDVIRIGPDGGFGELFENAGQFGSEVGPITDLIRHAVQSGHDGVLSLSFSCTTSPIRDGKEDSFNYLKSSTGCCCWQSSECRRRICTQVWGKSLKIKAKTPPTTLPSTSRV